MSTGYSLVDYALSIPLVRSAPYCTPFAPYPLIGHLPHFAFQPRQKTHEWLLLASKHFGGRTFRLELPFVASGWVVNDPACIKHVLSTKHSSFAKGGFFQGRARDLFGNGILIAEGSAWKAQRTAGHSLTTPPTLKHFSSTTLSNHLSVLLDPLDTAAASGETIDFEVVAMDYSLAVFGELAFDADWKRMSSQFSQPFTDSSAGIARRFQLPFYELIETLTEGGVKLRHDLDRVHEFARDLVQEALVEIREKPDTDTEGFSGKGLLIKGLLEEGITDEEELSDACLNFLTAGRDTTGQAITWTLYLLLLNPSYFSLLDSDFSTEMTTSPLLENIINESLRLHPPVPIELLQNVSSSPILLPDGTVVLPSEQIMWSPYVMARLPQLWGDDAAVFRPERWDSAANKKKTAFENPVFHAGPRSCLGQPLARLEIAYAMREVLQRYEFEMGWEGRRVVGDGLTGPVLGGLPVRVKRRGI